MKPQIMLEQSVPKEITTQTSPMLAGDQSKPSILKLRNSKSIRIVSDFKNQQNDFSISKEVSNKNPKKLSLKFSNFNSYDQLKASTTRHKYSDSTLREKEINRISKKSPIMQNFRFINNEYQLSMNSNQTTEELQQKNQDFLNTKHDFKYYCTYQDIAFQGLQSLNPIHQTSNNQLPTVKGNKSNVTPSQLKTVCNPKQVYSDFQKNFQTQTNVLQKLKTKEVKVQQKLGYKLQHTFRQQQSESEKSNLNEKTVVRNSLFRLEKLIENIHKRPDKLQYTEPAKIYNQFQRAQTVRSRKRQVNQRQKTPLTQIYMDVGQVPEEVNRKVLTQRELLILFSEDTKKVPFRF